MSPLNHREPAEPRRRFKLRRNGHRRQAGVAVVTAVAVLAMAGCGSSGKKGANISPSTQSPASSAQGGTLTIGSAFPVTTLNPIAIGQSSPFQWFNDLAYEPLIVIDQQGNLQPGLASSWGYVGSGYKTFDLTLRSDAKFSDGTPVTATAVRDYIELALKGGAAGIFNDLSSVTAVSPSVVQFQMTDSNSQLPYLLSATADGGATYIVSDAATTNPAKLAALASTTDGAGPYMLDSAATVPNSSYVYVPNPYYFDPSAIHWKKIVIDIITNENTMLSSLENGQIDVAEGTSSVADAAQSGGFNVITGPSELYNMTVTDPSGKLSAPLANVKVRQALAYAVDRQGITTALFGKYGTTDEELGGVGTPGVTTSLENYYSFDLNKARQLLAQAGYASGFTVKVLVTSTELGMEQMAEAVAADWAKIGVTLQIVDPPSAQWVTEALTPSWPLLAIGWADYNVEADADSIFTHGYFNYFHYAYPDLAAAESQYKAAAPGSADATQSAEAIESQIVQNALLIPVATQDLVIFTNKKVTGVTIPAAYPVPNPTYWQPTA